MDERRVPWLNMWMVFFAVVTMGVIFRDALSLRYPSPFDWTSLIGAGIILATVALVSILRLPVRERSLPTLSHLATIYLSAWKRLWSQRWLLQVYGLIAGVNLLATWADRLLTLHFLPAHTGHKVMPIARYLTALLPRQLSSLATNTLGAFFPRSGITSDWVIPAAFLLALPWLFIRLSRLRREEACDQDVRFVQLALALAGVVAVVVIAVLPWEFSLYSRAAATPRALLNQYAFALRLKADAWRLTQASVLAPIIIAGLIGSLKAGNQAVTADSFLRNSVRYFKPTAGICLLVTAVTIASEAIFTYGVNGYPYWAFTVFVGLRELVSAAVILLMFAPFAAVFQHEGAWASIRGGVRSWLSHAWQVVSFIAIGVTFVTMTDTLWSMLRQIVPRFSGLAIALTPVIQGIQTLVTAVMLLAVWEFYQLISKGETVEQPET